MHKEKCCRCYLLQRTVALGIPLLGVQTDNDPLTQEKGRPHDNVPDGTFPLVMQNEVEHHWQREGNKDEGRGINTERQKSNWSV